MSRTEELRLMTRVARLYYEDKLRQASIAERLHLSQATVSRLLKRAVEEGIVRITVRPPGGFYLDLEEALQKAFGLREVVVVDSSGGYPQILHSLGTASAFFLESTLKAGECVGISSWSRTLLSVVNALHPLGRIQGVRVVQTLGGLGAPISEGHAVQMTRRFAELVHGQAILLPAPGVVGNAETHQVLLRDPFVEEATSLFEELTLALVGIGEIEPSQMYSDSGYLIASEELDAIREQGAVGNICLRFYDINGRPVTTSLDERIVGITRDQLRRVRRVVGVAGGAQKHDAILGAVRGGWVHVLITDQVTGAWLLEAGP